MDQRNLELDSTQDGNPLSRIISSLKISGSTPTTSQRSSETTGARCQTALDLVSSTGQELSKIDADKLRHAMAMGNPSATDQVLVDMLPPQLAGSLVWKTRSFVDPVYGWDFEEVGCVFGTGVPQADIGTAANVLRVAMAPAPSRLVASELARMRALTVAKRDDDRGLELGIEAYGEEMRAYPSDVVRAACRGWCNRNKWWPSWAELKAELDGLVRRRRLLAKAVGVEK